MTSKNKSREISPEEFVERLNSNLEEIENPKIHGKPQAFSGYAITGDLNLRNLRWDSSLDLSECFVGGTLDLRNARIQGSLDLTKLRCRTLLLNEAIIEGGLNLDDVQLPLEAEKSETSAGREKNPAPSETGVNKNKEATGHIDMSGARVAGKFTAKKLHCGRLDADSVRVEGDFRFDHALILGRLNLLSCSIQGSVRCHDPLDEGFAEVFNNSSSRSSRILSTTVSQIYARGATIGGELDLTGLNVLNLDDDSEEHSKKPQPAAILLDHAKLGANLTCNGNSHGNFCSNGPFSAIGVKIEGNFQLRGAKILVDKNSTVCSLNLSNAKIGGEMRIFNSKLNQSFFFYGTSVGANAHIEALFLDGDVTGFSSMVGASFFWRFSDNNLRARDWITTIKGSVDLTGIKVKNDLEFHNIWASGLLRLDMASVGRLLCGSNLFHFVHFEGNDKDALEYTVQPARFGEISILSAKISHDANFSGVQIRGFPKTYRPVDSSLDDQKRNHPKGSLDLSRSTVGGALKFGFPNERLEIENWLDGLASVSDMKITSHEDLLSKLKPYQKRYKCKDPFAARITGNLILIGGEVKGRINFSGVDVGIGAEEKQLKGIVDLRDRRIGRDIFWGHSLLEKRSEVRRVDMSGITCGGKLDMTGITISGGCPDKAISLNLGRAEVQDSVILVNSLEGSFEEPKERASITGRSNFSAASFGKLVIAKKCFDDFDFNDQGLPYPQLTIASSLRYFFFDSIQRNLKDRKKECKKCSKIDVDKTERNELYSLAFFSCLIGIGLSLLALHVIVSFCLKHRVEISASLSNIWALPSQPQSGFPPLGFPTLTYLGFLIAVAFTLFWILSKCVWALPFAFYENREKEAEQKRKNRRLCFRDLIQVFQSLLLPGSLWGLLCRTILLFLIVTPLTHGFVSYSAWLGWSMDGFGGLLPQNGFSTPPEWPFLSVIFILSLCFELILFSKQISKSTTFEGTPVEEEPDKHGIDLTGVHIDHIEIFGGNEQIPETLKLDGLNTRLWTFDEDTDQDLDYVKILENTRPYQASNYAAFEVKSRNEGDYDSADDIRRAMKRQEQFRDERSARTFWLLLQSIIGYGTQRDKLIVFLSVWFIFTTALFYLGWHEGQFALDPDLRAQAETGSTQTVEAYRDWLYLDGFTSLESLGASAALALRYHIPLIHLDALPEVIPVDFLRVYATFVSFAHWIILPLLLGSLLQSLIPKRE